MATRKILTDEQVALEIERLKKSEYVKLSAAEQRLKTRRRQRLYQLRWMEKHGKELAAAGITLENIAQQLADIPDDENEEGGC